MSFIYEHVRTEEHLRSVFAKLRVGMAVLDIETTGLNRFQDTIVSFQLCAVGEEHAYYVDGALYKLLPELDTPLVLHNYKFDVAFLAHHGVDLSDCVEDDTMLLHHLHNENASHALDDIVKELWSDPYKEVFWSRNERFQDAPFEEAMEYACKDVIYTGKLYEHVHEKLKAEGVPLLLTSHIMNLAHSLLATEMRGVKVDLDYLVALGSGLKAKIDGARAEMTAAAPEAELIELAMWEVELEKRKTPKGRATVPKPAFNWDSPKQLQQLFYSELGLPKQEKKNKQTKQWGLTTDDEALEKLDGKHPVVPVLRDYRANQKVYGTYIEGTLERQVGGRIYPNFNENGTVTGRISSSNPNMQNVPREGGVRGIYVPDPGHKFISCDYGQLEVVVAAHFSQDKNLLRIINDGASKHDITAHGLGVPRQQAKTINFAMQYGATEFKIKQILGCSVSTAKDVLRLYWETYAGEKAVVDACRAKVDKGEPIINLFGRRRRFPTTFEKPWQREEAYRQAYSSLIQGTGADLTNWAFYTYAAAMKSEGLGRAVWQVHDEIVGEAVDGRTAEAIELVKRIMVESGIRAKLSLPLTVDCSEPLDRWQKG